jgi:hypothetical protein
MHEAQNVGRSCINRLEIINNVVVILDTYS